MAYAHQIEAVASHMPGISRWDIEAQIDAGTINPDNYVAESEGDQ